MIFKRKHFVFGRLWTHSLMCGILSQALGAVTGMLSCPRELFSRRPDSLGGSIAFRFHCLGVTRSMPLKSVGAHLTLVYFDFFLPVLLAQCLVGPFRIQQFGLAPVPESASLEPPTSNCHQKLFYKS